MHYTICSFQLLCLVHKFMQFTQFVTIIIFVDAFFLLLLINIEISSLIVTSAVSTWKGKDNSSTCISHLRMKFLASVTIIIMQGVYVSDLNECTIILFMMGIGFFKKSIWQWLLLHQIWHNTTTSISSSGENVQLHHP